MKAQVYVSNVAGYSIPVKAVLVRDLYPVQTIAKDTYKPSNMFDGNSLTFYHAKHLSPSPEVKIYFGDTFIVSKITFMPRLNQLQQAYLQYIEDTIFSIIKEDGEEEICGILSGVNTTSTEEEVQTYEMQCENRQGVGLRVWKDTTTQSWCSSKIQISYSNRKCGRMKEDRCSWHL